MGHRSPRTSIRRSGEGGSMTKSTMVAAVVVAVLTAGCSGGSGSGAPPTTTGSPPNPATRPSTPATLAILQPKNGEVFTGAPATIHVKVKLTGARIVRPTA